MANIDDMHDFLDMFQGPEIDRIEAELLAAGQPDLSARLNRLSIDAMIEFMAMKTSGFDPESGPSTAQLAQGYRDVTLERLTLLDEIRPHMPGDETLETLCDGLRQLREKTAAPAPPSAQPHPKL